MHTEGDLRGAVKRQHQGCTQVKENGGNCCLSTPKAEVDQMQPWSGLCGCPIASLQDASGTLEQILHLLLPVWSRSCEPILYSCSEYMLVQGMSTSFFPLLSVHESQTSCRKANSVWTALSCHSFCCTPEQLSGTWSCLKRCCFWSSFFLFVLPRKS